MPERTNNRLLKTLGIEDRRRIFPRLKRVSLDTRTRLQTPDQPVSSIYFLETAVASVVAVGGERDRVEIGLIGPEGCSGSCILLGDYQSPHEVFVQIPGTALEIPAVDLRELLAISPGLRAVLLAYAQAFFIQVSYTVLASSRQKLEGRLARWILMSLDRVPGDELPLTHDLIAAMLGVRRPGVTIAIHMLEGKGLIKATRNRILVLDRAGLEASVDGFYGVPEREYRRLIG
ncbi:cyclic nucleotide-binding protein [Kaistia sp. 32K]|uniref:Crp/Fnr family transcriptional regulator n=1 Tax=Kaistia sp. 32K TaxID=2795690 RepID=UPI00191589AD|nr:Crp/Fnr family transcriptional regulator [Kaistia sp. 32K]BCP52683.1 cyclic nucleotide-binding protein [Kaistia sp. 32K]